MNEKQEELNISSNKPSIKILVGYHKPAVLLKDEILTPIHLGRVLATQASKDGEISKEDYEWMCENMIGDDTGDNISHLNRYFCELTGIYWAWKNYDKLGNPDYIGFMHYNKFLLLDEKDNTFCNNISYFNIFLKEKIYHQYKMLKYKINRLNAITINPYFANITVDEFYKCNYSKKLGHVEDDFELLKQSVKNKFPQYNFFLKYSDVDEHYFKNIFIMEKKLFFKYCSYVFEILFYMHEKINYTDRDIKQKRAIGFLSERLTGAFIYNIKKELAIKFYPIAYIKRGVSIAEDRIKNHLTYKVGKTVINAKNPIKFLLLPFSLVYCIYKHKRGINIYKQISSINPALKLPPLPSYVDYEKALRVKNHLSYRIGEIILAYFKNWYKGYLFLLPLEIAKLTNFKFKFYSAIFLKIQTFFKKDTYILFDNLYEKDAECIDAWCVFQYMQEHNVKSYYVLWKENPLYKELKEKNKLKNIIALDRSSKDDVDHNFDFFFISFKQLLRAKCVITSFGGLNKNLTNFLFENEHIQYININHGATLLKVFVLTTGYLSPRQFNKFLVSSEQEAEIFERYGNWERQNLIKIGMPRWDLLKKEKTEKKTIFIMFTWRVSFLNSNENELSLDLSNTVYYKKILSFFSVLAKLSKQYDIKTTYSLHHSLLNQCDKFDFFDIKDCEYIKPEKISKHIGKVDLFITDYSSLFFDFLFLNTPVIFYRHDYNDTMLLDVDLKDMQHAKSKDDMLFNIAYDEDTCLKLIEKYIKNGFVLEDENKIKAENLFSTKKDIRKKVVKYLQEL